MLLDYPSTKNTDYVDSILPYFPGWESWSKKPSSQVRGDIYVCLDGSQQVCKIGFTQNLGSRLKDISWMFKRLLGPDTQYRVYSTYSASLWDEIQLHRRFSDHRVTVKRKFSGYTEFYNYSDELKNWVASLPKLKNHVAA